MEVNAQLISFLTTLFIGILLGAIFDFYRVSRAVFQPRLWVTYLLDGLYWLIAIIITFVCLLMSNWAELRFYIFMGIILGAILYYKLCSRYTIFFSVGAIKWCIFIVRYIRGIVFRWILQPIGYLLGIFKTPFRYVKKYLKKSKEKVSNIDDLRPKS
jgi:spore cortex biosynthesis protein YabQ